MQRYAKKAKKTPHVDREVTDSASSSSCDEALSDAEIASISASRLKMRPEDSSDKLLVFGHRNLIKKIKHTAVINILKTFIL